MRSYPSHTGHVDRKQSRNLLAKELGNSGHGTKHSVAQGGDLGQVLLGTMTLLSILCDAYLPSHTSTEKFTPGGSAGGSQKAPSPGTQSPTAVLCASSQHR